MEFVSKFKAYTGEGPKLHRVQVDGKIVSVWDPVAKAFTRVHSTSERAKKRLIEEARKMLATQIYSDVTEVQAKAKDRKMSFEECEALAEEYQRVWEIPGEWTLVSRSACPRHMANSYKFPWKATLACVRSSEVTTAWRAQTLGSYVFYIEFPCRPSEDQIKAVKALGYTNKGGAWALRG